MIINIRGTNGSGKTTVATAVVPPAASERFLLHEFDHTSKKTGRVSKKQVIGYRSAEGVILVGRYDTACGGCDGIATIAATVESVKRAAALPGAKAVIYEGLLTSGLYQSFVDLALHFREAGRDHVFAYLDTDLEECIRRTRIRTQKTADWNDGNVRSKHSAVLRTRERALQDGHMVMDVDTDSAPSVIRSMIAGVQPVRHFLTVRR